MYQNSYRINKMQYISLNPWIPHSKYVNFPILVSKNQIWIEIQKFHIN